MNSMRCALSVVALSCLVLVACKNDQASASSASAPASGDPAADPAAEPVIDTSGKDREVVALGGGGKAKVVPMDGKTVADTPTYKVILAAPSQVSKGAEGTVTLEILPKEGWKLNKEFPTKLTVNEPSGVKIKKKEQSVADAVSFADKSGKWTVQFQADSSGGKDFTGLVKFAVCTETSCDPKKEQLAWKVAVAD